METSLKSQVLNEIDPRLYIDGEFVPAAEGETFDTINPANEEVLASVARGKAEDVDRAVSTARDAFHSESWFGMDASKRGQLLYRMAELVEKNREAFAVLDTLDNGKPIEEVKRVDLPAAIDCLRYYAGWADKIEGDVIPVNGPFLTYTLPQPIGVAGQIIPWNFPLMMAVWKIAPALACGCTVVLKPAEQTPLSILYLAKLSQEIDLPPGVFNVVTGFGEEAGAALTAHPGVDKIAFTGSPEVGQEIMRTASRNFTPVSLELGGKSPNIIFSDSDLDPATTMAARGIYFNQGEVCSAGSRVLVQQDTYDSFLEKLQDEADKLQVGDPTNSDTTLGALVSEEQFEKVKKYVDIGKEEGASVVREGGPVDEDGYFFEPTIFADVDNSMRIAQDEIFGPVVSVIPFKDSEEAIEIANDTRYGLAAGIWTNDVSRAHKLARRIRAGTVWINTYGPTDSRSPWGGYKESGFGRELGKKALDLYTETQSIWVRT